MRPSRPEMWPLETSKTGKKDEASVLLQVRPNNAECGFTSTKILSESNCPDFFDCSKGEL